MFRMTTRWLPAAAGLLMLASMAPTTASGKDAGCAETALRPHLDRLTGWSVSALSVEPSGGARIAMDLEGGGRTLLIAISHGDAGLNTFQMMRGKEGDSALSQELSDRLVVLYGEIGADPKVLECDRLKSEPPPPDTAYAELQAMFNSLHGISAEGAASDGVSITLLILVGAGVLLLAGFILFSLLRRRKTQLPKAPEQAPPPSPTLPDDPAQP